MTYRACIREQMNTTNSETPLSICQTTTNEEYKYDVNTRNLEESFFQNNHNQIENSNNSHRSNHGHHSHKNNTRW
jgi:hypothetical protein